MSDLAFALDKVSVHYGERTVLADISLTIARGEKVAVVGESGAGKSTLLGLLRQQRAKHHDNDIAWCPQAPGLVPILSVFHNIYMGQLDRHHIGYNLLNLLLPRAREVAAVGALATTLGLNEKLWASVDRLSGGQQQRVAVGRALFMQRPIFLGDEPVSALDAYQAHDIMQAITATHDTVVFALHDINLALTACNRIVGLRDGRLVLDAPSSALTARDLAPLYQVQHRRSTAAA